MSMKRIFFPKRIFIISGAVFVAFLAFSALVLWAEGAFLPRNSRGALYKMMELGRVVLLFASLSCGGAVLMRLGRRVALQAFALMVPLAILGGFCLALLTQKVSRWDCLGFLIPPFTMLLVGGAVCALPLALAGRWKEACRGAICGFFGAFLGVVAFSAVESFTHGNPGCLLWGVLLFYLSFAYFIRTYDWRDDWIQLGRAAETR